MKVMANAQVATGLDDVQSSVRPRAIVRALAAAWNRLGLISRFAIVSAMIILPGMIAVGEWVARQVENGIIQSRAAGAALYTDSFVEGRVQVLGTQSTLPQETLQNLDTMLLPAVIGKPIVGFRIWKNDQIVYAERRDLIGREFPATAARARAWSGEVVALYRKGTTSTGGPEIGPGEWFLEIYAPVRETGSSRVIALAETYELAPSLRKDILQARVGSWLLSFLIGAHMLAYQLLIVHSGSRTIEQQRTALNARISELSRMLVENTTLRQANQAGVRVTETNERYLRQIGADLHDGPLQLIGMAILRLDSLDGLIASGDEAQLQEASDDIVVVRDSLSDSMRELRGIAAGLALPEIEHQPLPELIRMAAQRHERRCGMSVTYDVNTTFPDVSPAIKVCLYRFLQEGLSNAFRHAGGKGQTIRGRNFGQLIEISVIDDGPGLADGEQPLEGRGQGLLGLRDRIESLGGEINISNRPQGGVRLEARFRISQTHPAEQVTHG